MKCSLYFFDVQWNNLPSVDAHFAENSVKSVTYWFSSFVFLPFSSISVMFGLLFFFPIFFLTNLLFSFEVWIFLKKSSENWFCASFNFRFTRLRYFLNDTNDSALCFTMGTIHMNKSRGWIYCFLTIVRIRIKIASLKQHFSLPTL